MFKETPESVRAIVSLFALYTSMLAALQFGLGAVCDITGGLLIVVWDPIDSSPAFANWQIMEQLVKNPSLPTAWLEIVAGDEKKFGSSSGSAKEFLRRRKMPGPAASE